MKPSRILILLVLICGLSAAARAQACCGFSLRFFVHGENGKPARDVKIKTSYFDFEEGGRSGSYVASGMFGVGAKYNVPLKISADGFEDFETVVEVSCGVASYDLQLKEKKSKTPAVLEKLAYLEGRITDPAGAAIAGARVTVIGANERRWETVTNDNGYFDIAVPGGAYTIELGAAAGFAPKRLENHRLEKGFNRLETILDVINNGGLSIEAEPVEAEKKP